MTGHFDTRPISVFARWICRCFGHAVGRPVGADFLQIASLGIRRRAGSLVCDVCRSHSSAMTFRPCPKCGLWAAASSASTLSSIAHLFGTHRDDCSGRTPKGKLLLSMRPALRIGAETIAVLNREDPQPPGAPGDYGSQSALGSGDRWLPTALLSVATNEPRTLTGILLTHFSTASRSHARPVMPQFDDFLDTAHAKQWMGIFSYLERNWDFIESVQMRHPGWREPDTASRSHACDLIKLMDSAIAAWSSWSPSVNAGRNRKEPRIDGLRQGDATLIGPGVLASANGGPGMQPTSSSRAQVFFDVHQNARAQVESYLFDPSAIARWRSCSTCCRVICAGASAATFLPLGFR